MRKALFSYFSHITIYTEYYNELSITNQGGTVMSDQKLKNNMSKMKIDSFTNVASVSNQLELVYHLFVHIL